MKQQHYCSPPQGCIITGCLDAKIRIFDFFDQPITTLIGHKKGRLTMSTCLSMPVTMSLHVYHPVSPCLSPCLSMPVTIPLLFRNHIVLMDVSNEFYWCRQPSDLWQLGWYCPSVGSAVVCVSDGTRTA